MMRRFRSLAVASPSEAARILAEREAERELEREAERDEALLVAQEALAQSDRSAALTRACLAQQEEGE